jgi:ABC-type glutathione transport system ATPase component
MTTIQAATGWPETRFKGDETGMASVEIRNAKVIHGVSVDVQDGAFVILVGPSGCGKSDGKPVIYGVRRSTFSSPRRAVKVVVEPTPSETQVVVRSGGQEKICVFRERVTAGPGETIHVQPNPSLVHLSERDTGHRLQ